MSDVTIHIFQNQLNRSIIKQMKKSFCAVFVSLLLPLLCFGQNDFHFSLSPRFSVMFGELTEILYDSDEEIISRLDWQQKPLLCAGFQTSLEFKNLILTGAFDYAFPVSTSYMYDYDWEDGVLYSCTKHPIESTKNIDTSAALAYRIKAGPKISVIPAIQFNYIYTDFEGGKGSGTRYGRNIKVYGIDYKRHSYYVFTGLSVNARPHKRFDLQVDFFAAPWLCQGSFDHHHGVKHPFSTKEIQTAHFTKFKAGLAGNFYFNDHCSLGLFANNLFGLPDKGKLYSDYYSDQMEYIKYQKSGANIYYIRFGTAFNLTF